VGERTEKELITAFCDKIAELRPQLVTFNGNSFDLPVLRYRAMVHGVSAPGLSARPYFHRYSEDAIDLCDAGTRRHRPDVDEGFQFARPAGIFNRLSTGGRGPPPCTKTLILLALPRGLEP
jgi:hypothetical protein